LGGSPSLLFPGFVGCCGIVPSAISPINRMVHDLENSQQNQLKCKSIPCPSVTKPIRL
jgi:hypothetical protein